LRPALKGGILDRQGEAFMSDEPIEKKGGLGENLFSTLIDLLPDYFYVHDLDMRLVYVNKAIADYFGLPKDQIVGKKFEDLEPDSAYVRHFYEVGRQIIASAEPRITDTVPYPEPDGNYSYYRRYDIPFRHPVNGEPMVMGLAQDMTDRVERQRQGERIAAMHREMEIAQEIQRSLRPKGIRADWIELSGFGVPAAYAGGDFYDWLRTTDGSVVLALGDVAGHGVGPALVAAECRAYWRGLAQTLPLRDAVLRLNELLLEDLSGDRFVTLAAVKMAADGAIEVFSAGHGPVVLRRAGGEVELIDSHTIPLGFTSDPPGDEMTVRRFRPGDTLLMFSDGVTDTRNPDGQLWNTDGLLGSLDRHRAIGGSDLLRAIDEENLGFAGGVPPEDDRTVVVATFRGE